MTIAGNRLIAAAKEAREVARGTKQPASIMVPPDVDVRQLRGQLSMSQEQFANSYGFSLGQIRDWEQNRCRPIGALRAYLLVIKQSPELVANAVKDFSTRQVAVDCDELIAL